MPLPPNGLRCYTISDVAINQSSYGDDSWRMLLTMIAVSLSNTLIAPHAPDGVFDRDTKARKGGVVDDIIRRTLFATWFAARKKAQTFRMYFIQADIGQITRCADPIRQALQQARFFQDFNIGLRPAYAVSHINHAAAVAINAPGRTTRRRSRCFPHLPRQRRGGHQVAPRAPLDRFHQLAAPPPVRPSPADSVRTAR